MRQAAAYCERLSGTDLMEALRKKANEVEEVDAVLEASFRCPISMEIMTEPGEGVGCGAFVGSRAWWLGF